MKSYIIFERDGELEVVNDHYLPLQYKSIENNGGKILYFLSATSEEDAINEYKEIA